MTSENPPTPTSVKRTWFPLAARLPGERTPRENLKGYATDAGLYLYEQPPHPGKSRLIFHSPIDYDKTPEPANGYAARSGIHIHTEAGVVFLTPRNSCGCGLRRLKGWKPEWAGTETAWRG